ncbi:hypothetical protein CK203_055306 [Vitis vinifera]|uniref:Uncharacterized protein n=1 Tax=Vitis vinifera TaxID=29760 RepID=A0A438GUY8_VITVI|nr:hypothetical protein CK203_055306 [Vitis vinifera]
MYVALEAAIKVMVVMGGNMVATVGGGSGGGGVWWDGAMVVEVKVYVEFKRVVYPWLRKLLPCQDRGNEMGMCFDLKGDQLILGKEVLISSGGPKCGNSSKGSPLKDDTCSFSRHPGKMAWKGTDPSWSLPLELPRQGLRIPELYRNCGQVPHWFTKNSAHPYYRQGDPLALPLPQASVEILVHNHHPRAVSGFKHQILSFKLSLNTCCSCAAIHNTATEPHPGDFVRYGYLNCVFFDIFDAVEALLWVLVLQILHNLSMMMMNIRMCFCQKPASSLVQPINGTPSRLQLVLVITHQNQSME